MKNYDALLCGYYGMKNSGDDALLYAAICGARDFQGAERLGVTSPININTGRGDCFKATLPEQQRFRGQRRLAMYRQGASARRVIFGGGSVFHSAQDIEIKRHLLRLCGGNNNAAVGVGLGPFSSVAAEKACRKFLYECDFVGLRDLHSYELAKSLAPDANCHLTFDLAPLILTDYYHEVAEEDRRGVAVSLCPVFNAKGEEVDQTHMLYEMAYGLTQSYRETGEPVYLIDFNGHEQLGDRNIHLALRDKLGTDVEVIHLDYQENVHAVLHALDLSKAVIGMRLHAAILAYLVGRPVLAMKYHSKCEGWCDQVGMPDKLRFDCSHLDGLALQRVLTEGLEQGFDQARLPINEAITFAQANWR